jgi:hypothetical protein
MEVAQAYFDTHVHLASANSAKVFNIAMVSKLPIVLGLSDLCEQNSGQIAL